MSHEKFTDTLRKTGNNVGSNVSFYEDFHLSFQIAKLQELEKKHESEYDEISQAIKELEDCPQTETTTSEINRLKQRQANEKIKIRVTGLKAEKVGDDDLPLKTLLMKIKNKKRN